MTDYSPLPLFDINGYVWEQLRQNKILDENNYYVDELESTLIPVIPAQQIPEFNNLIPGETYLIYDYEEKPNMENWWISEILATYYIVSPSYDKINEILNYFKDTFRRYDDSAKDLNSWSGNQKIYNYHFIYIDKIVSPQHFANEGGFMMGEVQICVSYARNLNSNGRFI